MIRFITKDKNLHPTAKVGVICDFCNSQTEMFYKDYKRLKGLQYCCQNCYSHMRKSKNANGELIYVEAPYKNKEWLSDQYINKNRMAQDIAKECGINCRTLRWWIENHNLTIKKDKTSNITKEELYHLYVIEHKTTLEIGGIYSVSDGTILNLLKKYNIYIPNRSELMKYYYSNKGGLEKARDISSSIDNRIKASCRQRGIDVKNFQGFSKSQNELERTSWRFDEWRKNVFNRDNYTCQCCGRHGGNINAHHIYNFSKYEDLRYCVDNGITLCEECHLVKYENSFHRLYGERNNNLQQLIEFLEFRGSNIPEFLILKRQEVVNYGWKNNCI